MLLPQPLAGVGGREAAMGQSLGGVSVFIREVTGPESGNWKGVARKAAEKLQTKISLGCPWHEKLQKT